MSQYSELKAQIAKLQAQAEEARRTEIADVIASIREKITEYGLSAQDLGFAVAAKRGRPPKKAPLPPRYQDPKTGATVEYLLPRFTNVRRVAVDNSATPVAFWVGNNHGASIVKVEPLE